MAENTALRNNVLPYPVYGWPYSAVFPILDADGDLVTGAADLDSEISKNQDTAADCTNEAAEIATSTGLYSLTFTATEMTTNVAAVNVKTSTSGAKTTTLTLYPRVLPNVRTGTAQAGAASTITLDASANANDDYYNGMVIYLDGGTGSGQARTIIDYVGSSKVATVSPDWATNPSSDSTFVIKQVEASPAVVATVSGTVDANVVQVSGDATAADTLEAFVEALSGNKVLLADGAHGGSATVITFDRLVGASTSGACVSLTGQGAGEGLLITGGASGHGAKFTTAGSSQVGLFVSGPGGGGYFYGSVANSHGLQCVGTGTGSGMILNGGTTGIGGDGLYCDGGGSEGCGITAKGSAGLWVVGDFDAGLYIETDAAVSPMFIKGNASSPAGIEFDISANASAVEFLSDNQVAIGSDGKVLLSADAQTGVTIPTVSALTGHTAQTGDSYSRIGAPVGASISADIAALLTAIGLISLPAIQKNQAFSNFEFSMVDNTDHVTPKTGLTVSGFRSLDGSTPLSAVSGSITEIGNGIYKFDALAADTNCNIGTWRFTATGADDVLVTFITKP